MIRSAFLKSGPMCVVLFAFGLACSGTSTETGGSGGSAAGGNPSTGGTTSAGGSVGSGGNPAGGSSAKGGAVATGGVPVTGGRSESTGGRPTGGTTTTGGTLGTGGEKASGGSRAEGGVLATGGEIAGGGSSSEGGSSATGSPDARPIETGGAVAVDAARDTSGGKSDAPGIVSYKKDIAPLLKANCVSCHGPTEQSGNGVRVDTYAKVSANLANITDLLVSGGMPPSGALPDQDIQLFQAWVDQGAPNN